jgi:hypothetical protein
MAKLDPDGVAWSRTIFAMLTEGGHWGYPGAGLIFMKRGRELILTNQVPARTVDEVAAWQRHQDESFEDVKAYFGAAGIVVKKLL